MDLATDLKPPYRARLGRHRQYWRDMILGVNDGLVSIFLLVAVAPARTGTDMGQESSRRTSPHSARA